MTNTRQPGTRGENWDAAPSAKRWRAHLGGLLWGSSWVVYSTTRRMRELEWQSNGAVVASICAAMRAPGRV